MRKPRTYVLLIVDKSTSMLGVAKGVRVGVNSYLADLTEDTERDYRVSLVAFGERRDEPLCHAVEPKDVPRLTVDNYRTDGNTALLDAIGLTLVDFDTIVPVLEKSDRVLCIVASDGAENCSKHYTPDMVTAMVTAREDSKQWKFFHMAAGPDAAVQSPSLGLRRVIEIARYDLAREEMYHGIGQATKAYADGADTADITSILNDSVELVARR